MRSFLQLLFIFFSIIVLVSSRPQKDYDYMTEMLESTDDPGVAIDREVTTRHRFSHHHHKKHHHDGESKDYLKTNRLGKLRKYFEDHYL